MKEFESSKVTTEGSPSSLETLEEDVAERLEKIS
jgi:hypothetical protein